MKEGDIIWFLDSGRKRQAVLHKLTNTDAIIRFVDNGGGIRISRSRLFETEKEIDDYLFQVSGGKIRKKNQYDYMMEMK